MVRWNCVAVRATTSPCSRWLLAGFLMVRRWVPLLALAARRARAASGLGYARMSGA